MKKKFLFLISLWAFAAFTLSAPALADDSQLLSMVQNMQDQMKQMQKTIQQQNEKIQRLESQKISTAAPSPETGIAPMMTDKEFEDRLNTATGGANKWLKDLKFSGDLRLRYEAFHYNSGNPAETDDRNRFRYRLRYGFEKKFNDQMKAGFAMASGEQSGGANTDPNSTNTTFDNNFNLKPIFIERAYATYTPQFLSKIGPLEKTEITAGKLANPFETGSSDLVWDRDVRPEGIYEKIDINLIDSEDFGLKSYVTAGQFVLDEDGTVGGDANLFAYQAGITPSFRIAETPVSWLNAFSFYDFSNYARKSNFLIGTTSLARTNPNADALTTELDAGKFKVLEYYSELKFNTFRNLPAALYMDLAGNPADSAGKTGFLGDTVIHQFNNDFAWALGAKLGAVKQKGDWELGYQYKYIGANAVPAGFNDSDFGDGFTGKRGSVFKIGYGLTDTISLNGSAFFVENLNSDTAGILDQQQRRFQVDLVWKF